MANRNKGTILLALASLGAASNGCNAGEQEANIMLVTTSFAEDWRAALALLTDEASGKAKAEKYRNFVDAGKPFELGTTLVCRAEPVNERQDSATRSFPDISCDVKGDVSIGEGKFEYRKMSLPPVFPDKQGRAPQLVRQPEPGRNYFRLNYVPLVDDSGIPRAHLEIVVSAKQNVFNNLAATDVMSDLYPEEMEKIITQNQNVIRVESLKVNDAR